MKQTRKPFVRQWRKCPTTCVDKTFHVVSNDPLIEHVLHAYEIIDRLNRYEKELAKKRRKR